jgi:hypothetical protein
MPSVTDRQAASFADADGPLQHRPQRRVAFPGPKPPEPDIEVRLPAQRLIDDTFETTPTETQAHEC